MCVLKQKIVSMPLKSSSDSSFGFCFVLFCLFNSDSIYHNVVKSNYTLCHAHFIYDRNNNINLVTTSLLGV